MSSIGQRAVLGLLAEVGDGLLDLGEAHRVGVAHDRHDQALGRRHRDRDVEIVVIDDLVALDPALTDGTSLAASAHGLHEEAHEAEPDAVLLLEQILVAGARVDHRRHVDVVEGGQHRGGVLRFLEARAMVWRSRVILTRSSPLPRSPAQPGPRRRSGRRGAWAAASFRLGAWAPACAGEPARSFAPSAAASTSSLVSRPSLPVPLIFDGST
jgi:hypothetical protein